MKQNIFYLVGTICFYFSCGLPPVNSNLTGNQVTYDTVQFIGSKNITEIDDKCLSSLRSFYQRFGIVISDYYVIKDSLSVDLNNDSRLDTILILSPLSLEPIDDNCSYKFDTQPKRLLVEIISQGGTSKIRGIYSNLVSNVGGVLSHYNGLFKTDNGFKLVHEAGSKYSWSYTMEFSIKNDNLALVKVLKKCSVNDKEKKISYSFGNTPLNSINLTDTLSHQCNCDSFWSELDK
jgi:hypothetical protein